MYQMRRVAAAGGVLLPLLHRQPAGTGAYVPAPQRKAPRGAGLRGAAGGAAGSGTVGDPRRPRCPDSAPDRRCPGAGARRSNGAYRPFRQLPERRLPDLVRRRRWADVPPVRLLQPSVQRRRGSRQPPLGAASGRRVRYQPALPVRGGRGGPLSGRAGGFQCPAGLPHGGGRGCRGQRYLHHPGGDGFLLQRGGPAGPRA